MKTNRFKKGRTNSRREALPRGMKGPWDGAEAVPSAGGSSFGRGGDPRGLLATIAIALVVAGAGLFHVWTRSEHLRLGYAIVAAEQRVRAADGELARLNVEVASLSSPNRIARVASERLGLRAPDPGQVIDLPDLRDAAPAVATQLARVP